MALQSFEKRRPTYTTTPQDPRFRVEPGTLKFDVGGGAQDYAETRPVVSDPGRIPQSLRDSAFGAHSLRPLMQGNSDGSPLSLADMESNTRAMDALDEHFSLRPSAKALELMQLEAETAKQEKLADDPLFFEREKELMAFNRRRFEFDEKARLEREKAEAEYGSYDKFVDQDLQEQIARIQQSKDYTSEAERQNDINVLTRQARAKQERVREYNIAGRPKDFTTGG
jgi:hypothetical protein